MWILKVENCYDYKHNTSEKHSVYIKINQSMYKNKIYNKHCTSV